jgi:hypothetical protein
MRLRLHNFVCGKWLAEVRTAEDDKILAFSSDENTKTLAFRRLGYLNTPDSTRELAERFVADTTPNSEATLAQGLLESSWRETAISELDKSLREREQVPQSIYHVLAMLLVSRVSGPATA